MSCNNNDTKYERHFVHFFWIQSVSRATVPSLLWSSYFARSVNYVLFAIVLVSTLSFVFQNEES